MAVKIRLMRVGKKKQPSYRVVVADSRAPRDGRVLERIGRYAPRAEPSVVEIDAERLLAWLGRGAQPTEPVQKLLESTGLWDQFRATRPGAVTVAQGKLEAHRAALADRPAPVIEPEEVSPEPAEAAPEPAEAVPEAVAEAVAEVSDEPVAEAAQEPAGEEPEPDTAEETTP